MSFDFDKLLQEGLEAADAIIHNKKEIEEVFNSLEKSISKFLGIDIEFNEVAEFEEPESPQLYDLINSHRVSYEFFHKNDETKKTGYNLIHIASSDAIVKKFFLKIKRSENGYPITIVDGKSRYVVESQNELFDTLGYAASNPQNHIMFKSFKNEYNRLKNKE